MWKLGPRQDIAFDTAPRADEERLNGGIEFHQLARDGESGIEMSAGAAPGEDDSHAGTASGSVAAAPTTFSRVLPMFTRMPVNRRVSTRFDRPYEMKGSVSPVVGSNPSTTPMWMYAVSTVVKVSPIATSGRNCDLACRAMRKPIRPYP